MKEHFKKRIHKNNSLRKTPAIISILLILMILILFLLSSLADINFGSKPFPSIEHPQNSQSIRLDTETVTDKISEYAMSNNLSVSDYPDSMIELLAKNPETEEFVLNYPLNKNNRFSGSLYEYEQCSAVPLLMQWDIRWGYTPYGSDVMGLTGCGPTCLSMVAIYVLGDTTITPSWVAKYSIEEGYCVSGSGTSWSLMSDGARDLGINAYELPLDENRIKNELEAGNPIICIMGPGDFTDSGHFIVLTGYKDGKLTVNDPNSYKNSEKHWNYDDIKGQIRNLWAYKKS